MNVRKRGNKYQARVRIDGTDYTGTGFSKTEALEKLKNNIVLRTNKKVKSYSLESWIKEYFKLYKNKSCSPATLKLYNSVLNNFLPIEIKIKNIKAIAGQEIQKVINNVDVSRSKQILYIILKQIFDKAYSLSLIDSDVMKSIDKPKHKQEKGRALEKNERKYFLDEIKNSKYELFFKILYYTGTRRSEAYNLTSDDIDFVNNIIFVRGTKTEKSIRIVPLFNDLKEDLLKIKNCPGKLFSFHPDTATKEFKKILPNHKLHDLRHNFATICLERGVTIATISSWLGHSKISTTLDIYTHMMNEFEKSEIQKFNMTDQD